MGFFAKIFGKNKTEKADMIAIAKAMRSSLDKVRDRTGEGPPVFGPGAIRLFLPSDNNLEARLAMLGACWNEEGKFWFLPAGRFISQSYYDKGWARIEGE